MASRQEKLSLRAWLATFGSWGATRRALARFDPEDRLVLRGQINRLINTEVKRLLKQKYDLRSNLRNLLLWALPTVAKALTPKQFSAGLDLATCLAERKMDSHHILRSALPAAAEALTPKQFSAGLALATRLAERGIYPAGTLQYSLPAAAKALTPEQFTAGLALAIRLTERKIDPCYTLQHGLPAVAQASPTLEAFQVNLQAFEVLVTTLAEQRVGSYSYLGSYSSHILQVALPAAAKALTPEQFTAGLSLAIRLAEQGIYPAGTLQYGLPAAAKALTPEQFSTGLDLATHLAKRGIDPCDTLQHGLPAAAKALTPEEFSVCLALCRRLVERGIDPSTSPGLVELTRQAIALKQQYEDFELVWHPEVTHTHYASSSYDYTGTVVDYPAWVELRLVGRRIAPVPLEAIGETRLKTLLAQRSWLWQFHADHVEQERALERIAHLQDSLPAIVDQLIRHGVLELTARLTSAYLIGSYPWVPIPADIDLFLVVDGRRDVTFFTAETLTARGIQVPELPVGLTVEIIGHGTLLQASRGELVANAKRLALRHTLLYGSVLLAGHDLFETTPVRREALAALRKDLLEDRERANWPELGGDRAKIVAKQVWRQCEANALAWCIGLVGPSTDFLQVFETTKAQEELDLLASLLTEGFQKVTQAMAEGQKQAGLKAFQARFGVDFLEAHTRLTVISRGLRFGRLERKRQRSARAILAAGPATV